MKRNSIKVNNKNLKGSRYRHSILTLQFRIIVFTITYDRKPYRSEELIVYFFGIQFFIRRTSFYNFQIQIYTPAARQRQQDKRRVTAVTE
jgi:hypothetical protein